MKAKVTSKGQVTIPVSLRKRLGIRPGTVLDFDESAPVLTARRVVSRRRMEQAAGALERELAGKSSREWLDEMRGAAELPRK
jgi:AbrB family looped-hinge helix DNA binding protein